MGKTPSKKAKKAVTPSGENKKQTSQKKTASKKGKGDDDQGQEEQEDCSAAKCLRPVGKEVSISSLKPLKTSNNIRFKGFLGNFIK